jgi:hypothetical protein
MRIILTWVCLALAVTVASSVHAEVKKPVVATAKLPGNLKVGPTRISKEDCDKKKGTIKDVIFSVCASGQYCSYTKPDGTADAECMDKKQ